MSLEQRCQQFHEAALGVGKSKGATKEIATLRKFLHKNQDQRFTDKGVSRLFDSIQLYIHKEDLDDVDCKEGLLEDALKMPFTVFSTKQKKSLLKWLEVLRGGETTMNALENDAPGSQTMTTTTTTTQLLSLIDLMNGKLSLMDDETGDTFEDVPLPQGDLGTTIQNAFDNSDSVVSVEAQIEKSVVKQILGVRATDED